MENIFNKEECSIVLDWDCKGASNLDWNQTLITRINEIAKHIHINFQEGGSDTVYSNPKFEPMFKTMEYYRDDTKMISSRHQVVFDDNLDDTLYVYNSKIFNKESKYVSSNNTLGAINILNFNSHE